jgi:hypothetical protein
MPEITLERLRAFVIAHGDIKIVDRSGKTIMLRPDVPDVFDLIAKADRFWYGDRWHSREGFLHILGRAESADAE